MKWSENSPRPTPLYTQTTTHINTCHPVGFLIWTIKTIILCGLLTGWCVYLHGDFVFLFTVKATALISQCLINQDRHHLTWRTGLLHFVNMTCEWDMKDSYILFNTQWPLLCIWTLNNTKPTRNNFHFSSKVKVWQV